MYKHNLLKLVFFSLLILCTFSFFSCDNSTNNELEHTGEEWESMVGTTWYILEGNGLALERWQFYSDSVVVDIDHFNKYNTGITDSLVVYSREKHVARVWTKDIVIDYETHIGTKILLCTELQWKRMVPGAINPYEWTPVYDWSVYQMWSIEWRLHGIACIGDAPNCYEMTIDKPIQPKYMEGWLYDRM